MKTPFRAPHLAPVLMVLCLGAFASSQEPYVNLDKHVRVADFAGSSLQGVVVTEKEGALDVHLGTDLERGQDAMYGVKDYVYGTLTSPVLEADYGFDTAIASWNARTPPGTWLQLELRAYRPQGEHWTQFYNLGVWSSAGVITRRSVAGQEDKDGFVATDTLLLFGDPSYRKYQYRLTLFSTNPDVSPQLSLISVMTSDSLREPEGLALTPDKKVWGTVLEVPERSQMIYPNGGEVWCSPTSTSMVLAYWGFDVPVPQAARATYDAVYDGNGNWPFNTAWAGTFGLEAYVTRLGSMATVERYIEAGVPVVMSFGFEKGELPNTPIEASGGHLMVIVGFTENGDVVVNDPAGSADSEVRRVYDRDALEGLWLEHSGGTVYLIYPQGQGLELSAAN